MTILLILLFAVLAVGGVLLLVLSRTEARGEPPASPALAAIADTPSRRSLDPEPTVTVILPALNEQASIPWVLENIPEWVSEVVLIDGLSTDDTEAVARRLRPDIVVVHQHIPGKGAAVRAGFAAAKGDVVVMIDADGSNDPREMHRFVDAIRDGGDFVKGSRHMLTGGSADLTPLRSAGNRTLVRLANLLYRSQFTDLCYGYCAFWRRHLDALALTADGFEIETQLALNAMKAGLDIREVPSYELARRAGNSNLKLVRDGARILRTMLLDERRVGDSPAAGGIARVRLIEIEVPVKGVSGDADRRQAERRELDPSPAGDRDPDRRRADRRADRLAGGRDTAVTARVLRAVA